MPSIADPRVHRKKLPRHGACRAGFPTIRSVGAKRRLRERRPTRAPDPERTPIDAPAFLLNLARMPNLRFRSLIFWAIVAALTAFALAAGRLGLPASWGDVAVAASFLLLMPIIANTLTCGYAASWFRRLPHTACWTFAYALAFVALCAPRLGWPLWVSWVCGGLGVASSVLLSIARPRLGSGPNVS
jgi:hypothetical protein